MTHPADQAQVVVAYPTRDGNASPYVSRAAIEKMFFGNLAQYVRVVALPAEYLSGEYEYEPRPDYLFVDLSHWNLSFFAARERGTIRLPFILFFHVVYGYEEMITYLVPLLKKEDVLLVSSQYARNCLLRISPGLRVLVVPFALDVAAIQRQVGREPARNGATISFMGRLKREKGIEPLLDSLAGLRRRNPAAALSVIAPLSGEYLTDAPSPYFRDLEKKVNELALGPCVTWHGGVTSDEKYNLLAGTRVFANPSTYLFETFGVVNIEALACGVPVVCSRWSAFEEIVEDGKNGFVVDVKKTGPFQYEVDADMLADRVQRLLDDPALHARMRGEAVRSAYARYDAPVVTPVLVSHLQKEPGEVAGDWEAVRNQSPLQWGHLYCPEWLRLFTTGGYFTGTYGELPVAPIGSPAAPPAGRFGIRAPGGGGPGSTDHENAVFQYLTGMP